MGISEAAVNAIVRAQAHGWEVRSVSKMGCVVMMQAFIWTRGGIIMRPLTTGPWSDGKERPIRSILLYFDGRWKRGCSKAP